MKLMRSALAASLATALALSAGPAFAQAARPPAAAAAAAPAKPQAAWSGEAQTFVMGLLAELSAINGMSGLSEAEKQKRVAAVLSRHLAVEWMGAFLLGANRAKATPEQLAEYNRLVPAYIASSFATRINELAAQNLKPGAVTTRSPQEVIVATSFLRRSTNGQVQVSWRVAKQGTAAPKLLDVAVNGVSPLVVQREEFSSLVKQGGFDGLLNRLRSSAA